MAQTYAADSGARRLVERVRRALTDDLRRAPQRAPWRGAENPMAGHCYVASEALWHLLGGAASVWQPIFVRHEAAPHWFLRNRQTGEVLDPTADQFSTPVPYRDGTPKGFLTREPSRRAREVMRRVGGEPKTAEAAAPTGTTVGIRVGYHVTTAAAAKEIERVGFKATPLGLFNEQSLASRYYAQPVSFFSTNLDEANRWVESLEFSAEFDPSSDAAVLLTVDVSGLPIGADIPRLCDLGAAVGKDGLRLSDMDDAGEWPETAPFEAFWSDAALIERCVELTETFVVLGAIGPGRIRKSEAVEASVGTRNGALWTEAAGLLSIKPLVKTIKAKPTMWVASDDDWKEIERHATPLPGAPVTGAIWTGPNVTAENPVTAALLAYADSDECFDWWVSEMPPHRRDETARERFRKQVNQFRVALRDVVVSGNEIRIWRAISTPGAVYNVAGFDKQVVQNRIGTSWAWKHEGAFAYEGGGHYMLFVLEATAPVSSIDIEATAQHFLGGWPEEIEIRLRKGAPLTLHAVLPTAEEYAGGADAVIEFDPPRRVTAAVQDETT